MDALLIALVTWLSINYGLPATDDIPEVRFAPPIEITFLHYQAFTAPARERVLADQNAIPADKRREVVSVYDTLRGVILLPDGWTGRTPAELSVLVHEMVHHLQTVAELRYACPAEREKLAYEAQERWLEQFHTSLEREFGIDKLTLLVSTNCGM
jgi:Domain of unknown function (DUF6647)